MKQKTQSRILDLFVVVVIAFALYAHIGGMMANLGAHEYVKRLEAEGQECTKIQQDTGPPHTRKVYWICDGVEIKWWEGHFYDWWDK